MCRLGGMHHEGVKLVQYKESNSSILIEEAQRLTIVGWGDTNANETASSAQNVVRQLQVGSVSQLDTQSCKEKLRETKSDPYLNPDLMICAYDQLVDACLGDSGGPLLRTDNSYQFGNPKNDVQIGIVSWGTPRGCTNDTNQDVGVYTKLSYFQSWIDRILIDLGFEVQEQGGLEQQLLAHDLMRLKKQDQIAVVEQVDLMREKIYLEPIEETNDIEQLDLQLEESTIDEEDSQLESIIETKQRVAQEPTEEEVQDVDWLKEFEIIANLNNEQNQQQQQQQQQFFDFFYDLDEIEIQIIQGNTVDLLPPQQERQNSDNGIISRMPQQEIINMIQKNSPQLEMLMDNEYT
eukprot:TRINITY_DN6393_c0_g2_i1.p2 TRINITY_DN6393_c0_g2~~TRINITY_DN6393_c0_g2_i1.p2  ORF type:complete len:349 (-),score=60.81 TRINITY_DN6393_c0_g2_i1:587-1633(-)